MTIKLWQLAALIAVVAMAVVAWLTLMSGRQAQEPAQSTTTVVGRLQGVITVYQAEAYRNVREAVPAIETWRIDHGTYEGATGSGLKAYDSLIENVALFTAASTYCMESVVHGMSAFKNGPRASITAGTCPGH
jgi:hypothetical protein